MKEPSLSPSFNYHTRASKKDNTVKCWITCTFTYLIIDWRFDDVHNYIKLWYTSYYISCEMQWSVQLINSFYNNGFILLDFHSQLIVTCHKCLAIYKYHLCSYIFCKVTIDHGLQTLSQSLTTSYRFRMSVTYQRHDIFLQLGGLLVSWNVLYEVTGESTRLSSIHS